MKYVSIWLTFSIIFPERTLNIKTVSVKSKFICWEPLLLFYLYFKVFSFLNNIQKSELTLNFKKEKDLGFKVALKTSSNVQMYSFFIFFLCLCIIYNYLKEIKILIFFLVSFTFIQVIRCTPELRERVKRAFEMMLEFYGMRLTSDNKFEHAKNCKERLAELNIW